MDTKIEIKQEDRLSGDTSSQNDVEFFNKNAEMNTGSNTVLLNHDCNMPVKLETKAETPFPDFGLENEREFLQEGPNKTNSDNEMGDKIEIKEEYWWRNTETSSVCGEIKVEGLDPFTCPRLSIEALNSNSENSQFSSAEDLRGDAGLYMGKDNPGHEHSTSSEGQGSHIRESYCVEKNIHPEQSTNSQFSSAEDLRGDAGLYMGKDNPGHEHSTSSEGQGSHIRESYCVEKNIHPEQSTNYKNCGTSYSNASCLNQNNVIQEVQRSHKCTICEKRFTRLSSLKNHYLIHQGKKPHQCEVCEKRFRELSNLKRHSLIHEGKRPYKCTVCEKGFIQMSDLRNHSLIHEGKKPHKCAICEKSFTQLSGLKRHHLIHEGTQM